MAKSKVDQWEAMSKRSVLKYLGGFVRYQRQVQGLSQMELSQMAGISRSTLSQLENGGVVSLPTFIEVMRALKQMDFLNNFVAQEAID